MRTIEDFQRFLEAVERLRATHRGGRLVSLPGIAPRRQISNSGRQFTRVKGKRSASLKARANRRKVAR